MRDFSGAVPELVSSGFYDKAVAALDSILSRQPDDACAWESLGRMYRAKGELGAAQRAYSRHLMFQPDDERSAYLLPILSEQKIPAEPPGTGFVPCPFVRIGSFLTDAEHATLMQFPPTHYKTALSLRAREYRPEISSKQVPDTDVKAIESWFVCRVKNMLPEILPRVLPKGLDAKMVELQLTIHADGDFFSVHSDNGLTEVGERRLSYVYYFHHEPRRFVGGDLLLYDTDVKNDACSNAFTRIESIDNMIVFFPSEYLHQVTPIQCGPDYRDGRFTVNGWIRD
jgi:hypothetical protein